ncbi:MAG TPA: zf-HC2 domain-containing protein [Polyangiaceae bacterium]|jgi:predicted anti-sigma-YlaC factor YlaD
MFSCRDATHLMTEEREGTLSGVTKARYRLHMLLCPHCKVYRRQLDQAVELLKEIPRDEAPVPPEVEDRLVEAFRKRG